MQDGYSICFNEWALDNDIKNELRLLLIISSLTAETGYCYASNKYFSELFGEREETISRRIKKLEDKGYISIEYEKRGTEVIHRYLRLTKISMDRCSNHQWTVDENVKENNISINNTSINNKENIKRKFQKPTIEEIETYCKERNNGINAQKFFDFYETNGWVQGKNKPIKDWKACVRTWEQKEKKETPKWFDQEIKREDDFYISEEEKRRFGIT